MLPPANCSVGMAAGPDGSGGESANQVAAGHAVSSGERCKRAAGRLARQERDRADEIRPARVEGRGGKGLSAAA